MKINLLMVMSLSLLFANSCKKESVNPIPNVINATNDIKSPSGFTWESSRNINFTVTLTDTRFQDLMHVISIYDGDPNAGGNLLLKGSTSIKTAFKGKVYLSKLVLQVYIVKNSPDNSKVTQIIQVGATDISTSIGL